jgi:multidrug efflux system membrane fusion protein
VPLLGGVRVALVLALISTAACASSETDDNAPDAESRAVDRDVAVPVVTARAEVKAIPVTIAAVGTVETIATVEIAAQATGQIRDILFTPGAEVVKGQPLFALDPRPFEAAVRQAQAVLARDTAQANDARAQRSRLENLFGRGLIPRDQYETQAATVAALDATLAADRAQLEQARLNLQYTHIAAPIAGRTGALKAHVGDIVRANDANPLVTINQIAPIDVAFAVPARYLVPIQQGASRAPLAVAVTGPAATRPGAAPGAPSNDALAVGQPRPTGPAAGRSAAQGHVTFIDNAVDATTATITLKATFPNRDRGLWPGLFVQVDLQLALQNNAVVVPAVAVQASQQGHYIYVVNGDRRVEMRQVRVDRQQGDESVIASGLRGGEEVVTEGQLRLTPGTRISTGAGTPTS